MNTGENALQVRKYSNRTLSRAEYRALNGESRRKARAGQKRSTAELLCWSFPRATDAAFGWRNTDRALRFFSGLRAIYKRQYAEIEFQDFLDALAARPTEAPAAFKKGALFKLGSVCWRVESVRRGVIHARQIDGYGNESESVYPLQFLQPDAGLTRLSESDVRRAVRLNAERGAKPRDPFAGLGQAIVAYLAAEREFTKAP